MNDPIVQAAWFDFIKYEFPHPMDKTLHYEDMQIFGLFHFQNIPYCPEKDGNGNPIPNKYICNEKEGLKRPGSVAAMTHILRSLTVNEGDKKDVKGTCFSWSLQLRILTHVMGDLHQPLHNSDLTTKNFPNGTHGGNSIHAKYNFQCSLHYLWDNDFLTRKGQYPAFTPAEANDKAKILMDKYSKDFFGDRLKNELTGIGNFNKIAMESNEFSPIAYGEIPPTFGKDDIYTPSENYVKKCHEIIEKQLAVAGYRLGNLLAYLLDNMPDHIITMCEHNKNSNSSKSTLLYVLIPLLLFPIVLGSTIFFYKSRTSRRHM